MPLRVQIDQYDLDRASSDLQCRDNVLDALIEAYEYVVQFLDPSWSDYNVEREFISKCRTALNMRESRI